MSTDVEGCYVNLRHSADPPHFVSLCSAYAEAVIQARKTFYLPDSAIVLLATTEHDLFGNKESTVLTESTWEYFKLVVKSSEDTLSLEVKVLDPDDDLSKRMEAQSTVTQISPHFNTTSDTEIIYKDFPGLFCQGGVYNPSVFAEQKPPQYHATASTSSGRITHMKLSILFPCSLLDLHYIINPSTLKLSTLIKEINRRRALHDHKKCKSYGSDSCEVRTELWWEGEGTWYTDGTVEEWIEWLRSTCKWPDELERGELLRNGLRVHVYYDGIHV